MYRQINFVQKLIDIDGPLVDIQFLKNDFFNFFFKDLSNIKD